MQTKNRLKLKIERKYDPPTSFGDIREVYKTILRMKQGDSFSINYMIWSKIGQRVRTLAMMNEINIVARRDNGVDIKNARVYKLN